MTELQDTIIGFAIFFGPAITAFVLVTFSPLRQRGQPARLFVVGLVCSAVAAFFSIAARLRGTISSQAVVFTVGLSFLVGALITLLASSETISEKTKDEPVSKSDDQSWRI